MTITLDATTSTATPRAAGPRRSLRQLLKSKIYALQDRVMDYALHSGIIYNVAWEDPRVDGELLRLGPEDNLLVLTTGGCNVLLARRAPALPLRASATGAWPLASRCP